MVRHSNPHNTKQIIFCSGILVSKLAELRADYTVNKRKRPERKKRSRTMTNFRPHDSIMRDKGKLGQEIYWQ